MKYLIKLALKYAKIILLTAILAAGMMFTLSQLPPTLDLLKIIIAVMFLAFQIVILWDNFVVAGTKASRDLEYVERARAEGETPDADKLLSSYSAEKGLVAAVIGSVPWILIYVGSLISRFVNLDPDIGSNVIFKFLYMFTNMPCYTIFLRTGLPDAVPFAFLIPLVVNVFVASTAYQCGHIYRFRVENDKKYKNNALD